MSSYDLRLPMINGATDSAKIAQIQSYLYQHVQQLNWVISAITGEVNTDNTSAEGTLAVTPTQAQYLFSVVKPLVSESEEIADSVYDNILTKLNSRFVDHETFEGQMDELAATLDEMKESLRQIREEISSIRSSIGSIDQQILALSAIANDDHINELIDARINATT